MGVKLKKMIIFYLLIFFCVAGFILFIYFDNQNVKISNYEVSSKKLDSVFDGYKIAVAADFHTGKNGEKAVERMKQVQPDIIVIAGDLSSMNSENTDACREVLEGFSKIAPVYFCFGNHEVWGGPLRVPSRLLKYCKEFGVNVINDKATVIEKDGKYINIAGLQDFGVMDNLISDENIEPMLDVMDSLIADKSLFTVFVFHRANFFDSLDGHPYDLVLSGHLHGGQVNLPIISKKLVKFRFGNDKYISGHYINGDMQLVATSGLDNVFHVPRIFNTPEIALITLKAE